MGRKVIYGEAYNEELLSEIFSKKVDKKKSPDDYIKRLRKLIPYEIVSASVFCFRLIDGQLREHELFLCIEWSTFGVLLLITPFLYQKIIDSPTICNKQITLSIIAYITWVFYLGGPFDNYSIYNQSIALLLVVAVTLIVAIFD